MGSCKSWIYPERRLVVRVLVDSVIVLICASIIPLFYLDVLLPFRRGYFCDDDTIRFPYRKSTVSDIELYSICLSIPLIFIILSELTQLSVVEQNPTSSEIVLFNWRIPTTLQTVVTSQFLFLFGAFVTEILTDTIKIFVGRLRPNFLDVCKSDFDCVNALDPHLYVQEYECSNKDIESVTDSRLSFPSGHTSIATYTMFFAILYLQYRLRVAFSVLLKPTLQVLLFLVGAYISLSRIQDHKHHWSDVVGGMILGVVLCLWVFCIHPRRLGKTRVLESFKGETQSDLFSMETVEVS